MSPTSLCLLPTGPVDSGVTQTPKHVTKTRKQQVTLTCSYISGHLYVYWYKQLHGTGPDFLIAYYNGRELEKGNLPDRFSLKQFGDRHLSELTASSLELNDSAIYLCASSLDTALQDPQPPAQKHSAPLRK